MAIIFAFAATVCRDPGFDWGGDAMSQPVRAVARDGAALKDELVSTLETHRRALLDVRHDSQRVQERIEKMLPEGQAAWARARTGDLTEIIPQGSDTDLRRYIEADDWVTLSRTVRQISVPGVDGLVEVSREGILTDAPRTEAHTALRRAYDRWAVASQLNRQMRGRGRQIAARAWANLTDAARAMPVVGERLHRQLTDPAMQQRIISNSAAGGGGSNVISNPTVADMRVQSALPRRLAGLVAMHTAPSTSFYQPVKTGRGIMQRRGATQADPARYPTQNPTFSREQITLIDGQITVSIDPLWLQDPGVAIDSAMDEIMAYIAQAEADAYEFGILHGDTAGTHQDTLNTWTLGGYFTAGQLAGSASWLTAWLGLRASAADESSTIDAAGGFSSADHAAALARLGVHAATCVILTGLANYYQNLVFSSEFTSVNSYGDKATLLTGMLGDIGGRPLILTDGLAAEYASTGLFTGSDTKNVMVYFDPIAYRLWSLPGQDFDADVPQDGVRFIGAVRRALFARNIPSTERGVAVLRNLT